MELFARKENAADPVGTATKNYSALGILFLIAAVILGVSRGIDSAIFPGIMGVLMIIVGILLGKRKILGVYLGWIYVLLGVVSFAMSSGSILTVLIVAYVGYWNYKAYKALKKSAI